MEQFTNGKVATAGRVTMNILARTVIALPLVLALDAGGADGRPLMALSAATPLPDVKGRIDHFAADAKSRRIFIAALGNGTVELMDAEGRHQGSIPGFSEPQGIAYVPDQNRIFVANGGGARLDILDASSLTVVERIKGLDDADNVRYDAGSRTVLVGYGEGGLAILDAAKGSLAGRIPLPGHPESFQLERNGPRVFVNVPSARQVVVVDRVKRQTVATWDVPDARSNFPMALDEGAHRLFVGTRSPAVMLVYDTDSGKIVARVPIGKDADDIYFDAERKRIYVICGEGRVDVIRQETPDRYAREASIETAPGARTGVFVPEEGKLFVAAPASGSGPARVLAYRLR